MNFDGFLSYIPSVPFFYLIHSSSPVTLFIGGNRVGKTSAVVMDFLLRLFRIHPVPFKNFYDDMPCRVVRFISETLPAKVEDNQASKNTQYPELIKRIPKELIVSDITTKRPVITIQDPYSSQHIYVEFSSFEQDVQAQSGVERLFVWIDEVPPYSVFEENYARLISTGGDMIITLTPASGHADWIYDLLYSRARYIYRTKSVVRRYREKGEDKPEKEYHPENPDITVIHGATDDNPYLYSLYSRESTDKSYEDFIFSRFYIFDDEQTMDIRRYGMFVYISGRIFKDFNPSVHVIDINSYFPDGIPHEYRHFRSIDYHESNYWACIWGALSPTNEVFIYDELKISPLSYSLYDICYIIAQKSSNYRYIADLIDPRAQIKSITTSTSPCEDMNRIFHEFKLKNICTGAYWRSFDTKGTRGRDEIRRRLKGSLMCGRPFNNRQLIHDSDSLIPTIWISSTCRNTIESLKNWSYEMWKTRDALFEKDPKEKPEQKFSHFCTALEGAMKEMMLTTPFVPFTEDLYRRSNKITYFQRVV